MIPAHNDLNHILQHICALSELPEPAVLKRLIDALCAKNNGQSDINAKTDELIALLTAHTDYAVGLATFILRLTNQYRQITLYTDTGIVSDHTFFASMNRLIGHRLLPLLPEEDSVVELVAYLFNQRYEEEWLALAESDKLLALVALVKTGGTHLDLVATAKNSILNAIVVLSYRISGAGLHPDLMNAYPELLNYSAAFVAQNQEAVLYVNGYRRLHELDTLTDTTPSEDIDPAPLMVMLDQCDHIVNSIRKRIYKTGISIRMTNMLVRLEQSILRVRTLINLLSNDPAQSNKAIAKLIYTILHTAQNRYSFGYLMDSNTHLLSRKVTENASRIGEHYISTDKIGYRKMFKKAAIGGFFIAFMATLKILAYRLTLVPIGQAFVNSMIYGIGFVVIHIAHGTVATKQPAMTAAAIASTLSEGAGKKTQQLNKLSELIVDILRTQFVAILGNISIAMPIALLIALAWNAHHALPMIDTHTAGHLLHDLDPIHSLALPHAAIAGVYLFLSGLISGYYDNLAAVNKIGERLRRHQLLRKLLPSAWLNKVSAFVENNLGAIMGNFIFGCFLGSTATIGYMLGLPLDIRHIAFSSANFVHGLFFLAPGDINATLVVVSFIGVMLIGLINLMVSFLLALMVALRAKNVEIFEWQKIVGLVFKHIKTRPLDFFWPRRETIKYAYISNEGQMIFEEVDSKEKIPADHYVVRRLKNKQGKIIKVAIPGDNKDDIDDVIKAYHKDERQQKDTSKKPDDSQPLSPLPKPEKSPQLPK